MAYKFTSTWLTHADYKQFKCHFRTPVTASSWDTILFGVWHKDEQQKQLSNSWYGFTYLLIQVSTWYFVLSLLVVTLCANGHITYTFMILQWECVYCNIMHDFVLFFFFLLLFGCEPYFLTTSGCLSHASVLVLKKASGDVLPTNDITRTLHHE